MGAAFEALKTRGYAGTSTRAVARIGGFNPALIFYYFGSLQDLLVSALAESSAARLDRYRDAAEQARSLADLVRLLETIYREDVESGHIRVVSEMVAAGVAEPELAPRVVGLMEPWLDLAEAAISRALADTPFAGLVTPRELASVAVTFYLGANLLTHLVPEQAGASPLLGAAERLAPLLELVDGAVAPRPRAP